MGRNVYQKSGFDKGPVMNLNLSWVNTTMTTGDPAIING